MSKFGPNGVLHSSNKLDWETPQWLIDYLSGIWNIHFDLDVCATAESSKAAAFISPQENALETDWWGNCWMNPPYGKEIGKWIERAWKQANFNHKVKHVVCLLPARTDTSYWHKYVSHGHIFFIRGRIKFVGAKDPAPFPSALAIFAPIQNPTVNYLDLRELIKKNNKKNK